MDIITIPNDNDEVMNSDRTRLVPWSQEHGWVYTGYTCHPGDHAAQIRMAGRGAPLQFLDLVCHGNPAKFDHIVLQTASEFGASLAEMGGFSAQTVIYLDSCNTGLTSRFGGPIAQVVAQAAGCMVNGSRGYMTGTHAEASEQCYAEMEMYNLKAYPGGEDAVGSDVWIPFHRTTLTGVVTDMVQPHSITVRAGLSPEFRQMSQLLDTALSENTVDFPNLRMAPDFTINYVRPDGVLILELYGNGSLLKDRATGKAWRVRDAEELTTLIHSTVRRQ